MTKRGILLAMAAISVGALSGCQPENKVSEGVWKIELQDAEGAEVFSGLYLSYPKSELILGLVRASFEAALENKSLYTRTFFAEIGSVGFVSPADTPAEIFDGEFSERGGLMFSVSSNPLEWFTGQSELLVATGGMSFYGAFEPVGNGQFEFVPITWGPVISLVAGGELPELNPTVVLDATDPDETTFEVTGSMVRTDFELPDVAELFAEFEE